MNLEKAARIAMYSLVPNRPYHVQWLVTRKCNYRCRGCDVWQDQDKRELTTEQIKEGLDVLRELDVVDIVFSGGNPLLRDDIEEILGYASKHFVTTVYDNGSMALEKIRALQKADFVAISLDTLDREKNDYLKGVNGAWNRAIHAIETLHEKGINVSVSPTISQLNLYEIVDLTKHFIGKNIPVWYCLYSHDTSASSGQLFRIGKKNERYEIVDNKAMIELCDSLIELKKKDQNVLITDKVLEAMKQLYVNGERTWKCRALQNFFMIDHLGRVAGCHLTSPTTTIFELPKVWNSPQLAKLRKTARNCAKCTYLCYIFYSIHGTVIGNLQLAQDRWRNAKMLLKKNRPILQDSAKHQ
jgi:MoaA/NifB/PqqE/SkfB family radical SAM enzyme